MKITYVMSYSALLLVALAASPQQPASQPPKEHTTRTRVVLLGTGTPVPDPERSGPATAIVVDDNAYLLDFPRWKKARVTLPCTPCRSTVGRSSKMRFVRSQLSWVAGNLK